MHEMKIDVEQIRLAGRGVDNMPLPDLIAQRFRSVAHLAETSFLLVQRAAFHVQRVKCHPAPETLHPALGPS
jgi:hypothetical protein